MFEILKKKSMKSALIRILLIVIIVVIILVFTRDNLLKIYEGPTNLETLDMDELPDSYVTTEVYAIFDNFAEYYQTDDYGNEKITDQYYIIPVGDEEFIGLQIDANDSGLAQKIYDETYEYFNGTRDNLSTTLKVTGSINEMNDETYGYYKEWFVTSGYLENPTQEEIDRIALPYILQVNYIGGYEDIIIYIALIIMGLFLLLAIIISIKIITGAYLCDIKKFLRKNASIMSEEHLEADFLSATQIEALRVGKICLYYFKGSRAKILKNSDIIWAYYENITHRTYGIKTGVSKFLIIYTQDKKKYRIPMKNADNIIKVLDHFSLNQPHIVIGFSEELRRCFKKDFNTFKNLNRNNQNFEIHNFNQ